jgi:hypothetical protein
MFQNSTCAVGGVGVARTTSPGTIPAFTSGAPTGCPGTPVFTGTLPGGPGTPGKSFGDESSKGGGLLGGEDANVDATQVSLTLTGQGATVCVCV